MVEMTEYMPGTPNWVEVSTPDMAATQAFYGGVFGWERTESDPNLGGYATFTLNGRLVCGATPTMSPDQPPAWSTYIATADADATAQAVTANGGQVLFAPMDVNELGRMAVFTDPTGAVVGAWQPGQHKGAQVIHEANAVYWNGLLTRDMPAAVAFYHAVFGHGTQPDGDDTTILTVNGQQVADVHDMRAGMPAEVPPYWLPYFGVMDTDATVAKAQELGGTVTMPAVDSPDGRTAVLADPHGAVFAIIQMQ